MNEIIDYRLLLDLGVLLLVALFCATLFQKLRLPPVIGMLIAGIVIGPFTPGFQIVSKEIITIGQIGAILILFGLGLEFKYQNFKIFGLQAVLLAGLSGFGGFAAGALLGFFLKWNISESLLLGTLFVSTSSTIALKMMEETLHLKESKGTMITKTAIVVDDLYGFIALALVLTQLQSGSALQTDVAISIVKVLLSIIVIFSVGIFLMPKIFTHIEKLFTGSSFAFGISFCLILSYAVISIGLSPLIGAFLAGTILTATMQYKDVLKSIIPIRNLFATVFFVTIGLSLDPGVILSVLPVALLISIVAIFSKALVFALTLRRLRVPLKEALLCGLATGPRGEISLIISQTANVSGIVGSIFLGIAASLVLLTSLISSILIVILNIIFKRKKQQAPVVKN